jgi:hypothetical protein
MKRAIFLILLLPILAWAAKKPFNGTWKLDFNKIQFPEKPYTLLLQNDTYLCLTCVPKISIKADGTDQPAPGSKVYDTLAIKILDDKAVEMTYKKGGEIIRLERDTVSADGKMLTAEFTGFPEVSKQPVTGKVTRIRLAAGPSGSHALSGSWRLQKEEAAPESALTVTYKSSVNGLSMSRVTGESFEAKFDSKDYPVKGDPKGTTVSLTMVNDRSIDETDKRDGKIVAVYHLTVSSDGRTLFEKMEDKENGTTTTYAFTKQ